MDITLLKTFLEVAHTRHFGKAADALFVTQSAVSARVKLLESNLGVALFTRRRNDIQLTPAGNRLRRHAETIVRGWERARHEVALEADTEETLALGCQYDLWSILARNWVVATRSRAPGAALQIEVQTLDVLVQRLVSGLLDLAILFEPPQISEIELRQVADISLILVSSRCGLVATEAMKQDYLLVDWGSAFAQTHAEIFSDAVPPSVRLSTGALALDLLMAVGGAAYLAEPMVRQQLDGGTLFRVEDAPVIQRTVFAAYHSGGVRRGLIDRALELLTDTATAGDKLLLQNQLDSMRQLAFHDSLTGLANRSLFREQLAVAMARSERRQELLAVLMMDLDGFKAVNDRKGHGAGDLLLQCVAQRLNSVLRSSDILARLGGDEFILAVTDIQVTAAAEEVAQKILDAIAQPFEFDGDTLRVGCSLGIVFYPFQNIDLDTLIHQADAALYEAKAQGKNRFACYQRAMEHLPQ